MIGSTYDYLRPSRLSDMWGLKNRQTSYVLAELEALGFDLPNDSQGARMVHPTLAAAVRVARTEGRELRTLVADSALKPFLRRGRAAALDPLDLLIEVAAEVALVREAAAALNDGVRQTMPLAWRAPQWSALGLPDPQGDL